MYWVVTVSLKLAKLRREMLPLFFHFVFKIKNNKNSYNCCVLIEIYYTNMIVFITTINFEQ